MSIHWMSWVWENGPDESNERFVLLKLADNANQEGYCYPSMADISRATRLSESTVRRCIQSLEKGGWVTAIKGTGRGNHSEYYLQKRVSGGQVSGERVSERKVSSGREKGVTVTEKGVTQTLKGVTVTEPPHPLNRVTVINHHEPSGEPSQPAPPYDFSAEEEANIPDDLPSPVLGNFILQRLSIPHSHGLSLKFASCVDLLARDEGHPRGEAARLLIHRGRDHPPDNGKWRFWLEDGSWKEREGISTVGWE